MTHDELLDYLREHEEYWTSLRAQRWAKVPAFNALRAVVELHKPFEWRTQTKDPNAWDYNRNKWNKRAEEITGEIVYDCSICGEKDRSGNWFPSDYPCETIQAIKKELK